MYMCAGVLCGPAGEWTLPGSHVCDDGNLLPAADWSTASTTPGTLFHSNSMCIINMDGHVHILVYMHVHVHVHVAMTVHYYV